VTAGFDYVHYTAADGIEVCVKKQCEVRTQLTTYPRSTMISVCAPYSTGEEYQYPEQHALEGKKPALLDGHSDSKYLSENYKIADLKGPENRYFRFDATLLECLELARETFRSNIKVVPGSAYRVRSENKKNIDSRHPEEKFRYQMGQAVEVQPSSDITSDQLINMASSIMASCMPTLRLENMAMGVGCHDDRLYVDVRPPLMSESVEDIVQLWDAGNVDVFSKLTEIKEQLTKGMDV
jgi:hypothetical protein